MTTGDLDFSRLAQRNAAPAHGVAAVAAGAAAKITVRVIVLDRGRCGPPSMRPPRARSASSPSTRPISSPISTTRRLSRDHQALRARAQLRQGARAAVRPVARHARQQPIRRDGPPALELHRHPPRRRARAAARGRLPDRGRPCHRVPHARRHAGTASPISTIRRSRASTSTNSTSLERQRRRARTASAPWLTLALAWTYTRAHAAGTPMSRSPPSSSATALSLRRRTHRGTPRAQPARGPSSRMAKRSSKPSFGRRARKPRGACGLTLSSEPTCGAVRWTAARSCASRSAARWTTIAPHSRSIPASYGPCG